MANSVFSLDIGEKFIKATDIDKQKDKLIPLVATFGEYSSNPYINNADEILHNTSVFISKLITEAHFNKREINIIIPDSQSYTRIFEMPLLTDKELISAVKYQADQFIPIPIEKVNLDVYTLIKDKKNNTSRILLVAAPTTVIDTAVRVAEGAALLPQSVENETSATLRFLQIISALQKNKPSEPGVDIYVNFGYTSSSIYLMDIMTGFPVQVHNFPIGVDLFKRDIKASSTIDEKQIDDLFQQIGFTPQQQGQDLNILLASPLNEFISEFKRFLISSKDVIKGKIQRVYIYGEGSKIVGIDAKLTSLLGAQVLLFNPYSLFSQNQVTDFFKNEWQILVPTIGGALR